MIREALSVLFKEVKERSGKLNPETKELLRKHLREEINESIRMAMEEACPSQFPDDELNELDEIKEVNKRE